MTLLVTHIFPLKAEVVQISIRGAQIPENIPDFEQAQNK
jgi:hypothetical protein